MGSFLSVPAAKSREVVHCETSRGDANKKIRISSYLDDNPRLIPSLPDEVSIQILARLPRIHYLNVKLISRRWMTAVMSGELFQMRRQLGVTEEWLYVMTKTRGDKYSWQALDPRSGKWQRLPPMPHVVDEEEPKRGLPGFWMWGEIYDPETSSWVEMPHGMGDGWPARQARTKLGTVFNGDLYALDPASYLDNGKIKMYDNQEDVWRVVVEKVPVCYLTDSDSPFLLAGLLGKLHVIMKDANHHIVILEADLQRLTVSNVSTSSTAPADSMIDNPASLVEEEPEFWKVIDAKDSGAAELVSCQVLDI
ncbi:hypothetical protein C4D60_Mb06t05330 [Musa balbisiana]|uniref:F-box domain-containing protein n=1 Tax=Musa balbisiana TaxID=52838 RepID=A0A4S8IKT9_MUSBA|nr:hypothetical protein C4D60_Mb06t05330 [Musa balbisiana]